MVGLTRPPALPILAAINQDACVGPSASLYLGRRPRGEQSRHVYIPHLRRTPLGSPVIDKGGKAMKIVVIGGTGLIGSKTARCKGRRF